MNPERKSQIIHGLIFNSFVRVTEESELLAEYPDTIAYQDDKITIYTSENKSHTLFLIEYIDEYYVALDDLNYIIKNFYKRIINK